MRDANSSKRESDNMIRRLFTAASVLSLLLFAAVVALWVRSIWVGDALTNNTPRRRVEIISRKGALMYYDQIEPPQWVSLLPQASRAMPARWSYSSSQNISRPDSGDETVLNRLGVSIDWREQSMVPGVFSEAPCLRRLRGSLCRIGWSRSRLPCCLWVRLPPGAVDVSAISDCLAPVAPPVATTCGRAAIAVPNVERIAPRAEDKGPHRGGHFLLWNSALYNRICHDAGLAPAGIRPAHRPAGGPACAAPAAWCVESAGLDVVVPLCGNDCSLGKELLGSGNGSACLAAYSDV